MASRECPSSAVASRMLSSTFTPGQLMIPPPPPRRSRRFREASTPMPDQSPQPIGGRQAGPRPARGCTTGRGAPASWTRPGRGDHLEASRQDQPPRRPRWEPEGPTGRRAYRRCVGSVREGVRSRRAPEPGRNGRRRRKRHRRSMGREDGDGPDGLPTGLHSAPGARMDGRPPGSATGRRYSPAWTVGAR